jgi:hypothetical protein
MHQIIPLLALPKYFRMPSALIYPSAKGRATSNGQCRKRHQGKDGDDN